MRRTAAILLASSLASCTRPAATAPPPEPTATAEPPVALASAHDQLRMQPTDPPPVFVDPQRRARLEAAFPAIDAYLQQTVARDRLVGLAAGIVIDGELA